MNFANKIKRKQITDKLYKESHKDKLKAYKASRREIRNEHFECDYGGSYSKARHEKCNKHIRYLNSMKEV